MDGLDVFMRRLGPRLQHFQDEQIVLVHETGIDDLAFEIGKTLRNQRRRDAFRRKRCQPESSKLLHIAA